MSDIEAIHDTNGKVDLASDDDSSISGREDKLKMDKSTKHVDDSDSDVENDHSGSTNNGFGVDGEPDYKPRKASSSSSSSSSGGEDPDVGADDDLDEVSASSESKKEDQAVARVTSVSPPKPKSRSTSLNQSLEEQAKSAKDSSDTEDEGELEHDSASAPVPVARKVSMPQEMHSNEDEPEVAVRSSPLKQEAAHDSDNEELSRDEWELSKRETVHLDEVVATPKVAAANSDDEISEADEEEHEKSASSSSSEDEQEEKADQEKEVSEHEPVVKSNGGSHHDAPSSSDDEPEPVKAPSPRKSLQIENPPAREEAHIEGERTPSPNVTKPNPDGSVTKAYIAALNNNNNNINSSSPGDVVSKLERPVKPIKDITQMYVENIAKISTPPNSPKPTGRTKPAKDITQLYTGKFEQGGNSASPGAVDKLSPKKHNMSTAIDKDEIRKAYDDVRSDTSKTEWAVFKFDGNSLGVTATGDEFTEFKALFGNDDRGFGYIRIKTGDEMSKRFKFVFVTWVGPSVSVMKKAKMSTDKALMKDIIQNLSVELQLENHAEFSHDYFKMQVDKAAGARYGTGVRDL